MINGKGMCPLICKKKKKMLRSVFCFGSTYLCESYLLHPSQKCKCVLTEDNSTLFLSIIVHHGLCEVIELNANNKQSYRILTFSEFQLT